MTEHQYTLSEKLEEIAREIKFRERAWGQMVQVGSMRAEVAAKRIGLLKQIAADVKSFDQMRQQALKAAESTA